MVFSEAQKERFWAKVDIKGDDDCWLWQGYAKGAKPGDPKYGHVNINNKKLMAHRLAYMMTYGSIPKGKVLMHSCNESLCVNPRHLTPGTHRQNQEYKVRCGRQAKGALNGRTKLRESDVKLIRMIPEPTGYLAKYYGVDRKAVQMAREGNTWTYLNNIHPPQGPDDYCRP